MCVLWGREGGEGEKRTADKARQAQAGGDIIMPDLQCRMVETNTLYTYFPQLNKKKKQPTIFFFFKLQQAVRGHIMKGPACYYH